MTENETKYLICVRNTVAMQCTLYRGPRPLTHAGTGQKVPFYGHLSDKMIRRENES